MAKYHINSNGDVKPCKATKIACQFGDDSLHFENETDARKVAEKALAKSGADALRGKKSNLKDLMQKPKTPTGARKSFNQRLEDINKLLNETPKSAPKPATPPSTPRSRIRTQTIETERARGFDHIDRDEIPMDVQRYMKKTFKANETVLAYFKRDDRYKVLVDSNDGTFLTRTTPDIRDVPHRVKKANMWNMALHPKGPLVTYNCARCGRENQERLYNFDRLIQGDCQTRCRCGQLNSVPISQN